ncbi:MAG: hypothetical protein K2W95_24815 [Candidatus Obscuribacterales bacterium]|nr:hypothetical protein [Candidatus Obscuribacterales bacterium]
MRSQVYLMERIAHLRTELTGNPEHTGLMTELLLELGHAYVEQIPSVEVNGCLTEQQTILAGKELHRRLERMRSAAGQLNEINEEWCSDEIGSLEYSLWGDLEDAAVANKMLGATLLSAQQGNSPRQNDLGEVVKQVQTRTMHVVRILHPHKAALTRWSDNSATSKLAVELLG